MDDAGASGVAVQKAGKVMIDEFMHSHGMNFETKIPVCSPIVST